MDMNIPNGGYTINICIEGNIACGKSTLLEAIINFPDIAILPEPIEKWKNYNGKNMLELMYQNPKKYMYDFQILGQDTISENHNFITDKKIKIMERSIYSERYVFIEMAYHDSNLTFDEYQKLHHHFIQKSQNITQLDYMVYLRCDPKICYDRLKKRNRPEEANITLDYLQKVHDYHEEIFINNQSVLPCNVIVINVNKSVEEAKSKFLNFIGAFSFKKCGK